jgi:hypothetical protein
MLEQNSEIGPEQRNQSSEIYVLKFIATKTVCSLPMILERVEASIPWQITQTRKTAYTTPFEGVQFPSRATTMLLLSAIVLE